MDSNRVLMVATVAATIGSFNMENIGILQNMGYKVDVAADFTDESVWPIEKVNAFKKRLSSMGIEYIQLDFSRSAFNVRRHISSYKVAVRLLKERNYRFIHTHTPIASAIIRLAAHKIGAKVIYTAHGFHFYKGAPIKNWVVFYPIEKWLSRYTDALVTICLEDYDRAKCKFKAKSLYYVPGVGVDTEKFHIDKEGRKKVREELGFADSQIMLLSIGELNVNKNHEAVIKAIKGLDIEYVVVGKGELKDRLEENARAYGVDLKLLGFRTDVVDIYNAADIYVLPSFREGLNVSLMEAMACGLPCCVSRIRGNTDLIDEKGGCLFDPHSISDIRHAIEEVITDGKARGLHNIQKVKDFNKEVVSDAMKKVYRSM